VGPNGAGKSTILKIMAGVLAYDQGEVLLGKDVTRAYFAQHQFDLLNSDQTVFEELLSVSTDESQTSLRSLLGTFLFSGEEIHKKVFVLSGGERAGSCWPRCSSGQPISFFSTSPPATSIFPPATSSRWP